MKTTEKQQQPLSILEKENGEMAIISNYSYICYETGITVDGGLCKV